MRYQLAGNDTKESSSGWSLLLSAELPQRIGLGYIKIFVNGSIRLLDLSPATTTERLGRKITAEGLPDVMNTQGKQESPLAEKSASQ